ncbi:MAG: helix-turn-helix domain-containing protein [Anaerolineales bacterium]|jgi:excisionase family DNA binding protein
MSRIKSHLLKADETIEYLGISRSTLHKIEQQGLLRPYRTPGGHRRYDLRMLNEYLESTRSTSSQPHPEQSGVSQAGGDP